MWETCRDNFLFFVNAFGWVYEPRQSAILPAITPQFQTDTLVGVAAAIHDQHDLVIEKSRDMRASWSCLFVIAHRWLFGRDESYLLVSRKEDLVDKPEDPKSLFWKLDFIFKYLPTWLMPRYGRKSMHLVNYDRDVTIDGESTTGDVARGDRRTAILFDEFASVPNGNEVLAASADTTDCRIFNSTPKGTANAFYQMREACLKPGSRAKLLTLKWSLDPVKAEGAYTDEQGKLRSPWYDAEVLRRPLESEVAQELDINYFGSDYPFFDLSGLETIERRDLRPPYATGQLEVTPQGQPGKFRSDDAEGLLKLWCLLRDNKPPDDRAYVIGLDISQGTGASSSCASIFDLQTAEKVAEYSNSRIKPEHFACFIVGLARWFAGTSSGAFLIWESLGPGIAFGERVIELGYRNVFYRTDETSLDRRPTDTPGWPPGGPNKGLMLTEYRRALGTDCVVRSHRSYAEAREYVFTQSGSFEHRHTSGTMDPTGARANHGDMVIADGLGWKAAKDRLGTDAPTVIIDNERDPPMYSFAWRRKQRADKKREDEEMWN